MLMRDLTTRSRVLLFAIAFIALAIAHNLDLRNCANVMTMQVTNAQNSSDPSGPTNPLLAKWEGPYGGVPPFDRVQVAQFKPALEGAMAENLAEIDKIIDEVVGPSLESYLKTTFPPAMS